ncbi:MAG: serine--tRNA ligase [Candidatus Promineifilaceae bacterium]|nr:serine--tRNA ligase [Candidatus Promineifilaceae bacterium]
MIDIRRIRKDPEFIRQGLAKRGQTYDFDQLLQWDTRRRELIQETEALKMQRNQANERIKVLRAEGESFQPVIEEMKSISAEIKQLDAELADIEIRIQNFLDGLPNVPDEEVPAGGKENNVPLYQFGEPREFDFEPKEHVELATALGLIDFERGTKLGGSGTWIYTGNGALIEWALLNYFVAEHLKDGYTFILPPHILTYDCGYAAGQFPKFEEDVYLVNTEVGGKTQFLLPTSETALVNLYRDEIIPEDELPKKFFSYTPCYRREAGGYRASERGTVRGHQFNKVEMFQYTVPDGSEQALQELLNKAETLVKGLGLHYRTSLLAAEDVGAAMAKTFDVEVWIPSIGYKEISSVSNARDYQARRGQIRFKSSETGKNRFVHTLNASGLATSRLIPAILEQFQQADGSVLVPEVLQKWVPMSVLESVG